MSNNIFRRYDSHSPDEAAKSFQPAYGNISKASNCNQTHSTRSKPSMSAQQYKQPESHPLTKELQDAIRHMVVNISKSFVVDWYASISPTNHDFVASCETLMEEVLSKFVELSITKLDKYRIGQLVSTLLHDHILNEKSKERRDSIEHQIDDFEYDICQNSVVRLFGLLSTESLQRVVFTIIDEAKLYNDLDIYSNLNDNQKRNNHQPRFSQRTSNGNMKSFSFDDIISSASLSSINHRLGKKRQPTTHTKTTSALYTLVIAMLTKAAFMPIIGSISQPKWLFAVIIWLCKKEERERMAHKASQPSIPNSSRDIAPESNQTAKTFCGNQMASTSIVVTNTKGFRSLDLEEGFDLASANINFENPVCDSLKRPLNNIEIFSTEEVKGHSSCYVLYCIRYDGLCYRHPSASFNIIPEYPDVPIIDRRQTHSVRRRNDPNHRSESNALPDDRDISNRKSFRRSMTIKRRFREFVLLQLRLEENPKIRPFMKNIPKPTKLKAATQNIFSLPGINNIKLDQSTIKLRQRFLERFLIALNSSPFIANSYEFKEFFSYNVNPAGMSRSKTTILQVNLNKVFVDSVRSAFSIIRSTLPGDDHQSLNTKSKSDPDAWLTELQQSTLKLHVQTRTSHSKMNLERYIDSKLSSLGDSPTRSAKSSSLGRHSKRDIAFDWMGGSKGGSLRAKMYKCNSLGSDTNSTTTVISSNSSLLSSNQKDSRSHSKSSSAESIYHDASGEMADYTTDDIIHYSISRNPACSKSPFNFVARLLLGRFIERYAIKLLNAVLTKANAAISINGITSSIWNENDDFPLDLENSSLDEAVEHLSNLFEQTYVRNTYIPKKLLTNLIRSQMRFYLSQLESQKRNKYVIYSFLVHLLDELEIVDQ